jgi:catechol 2,3-dioxygenase-like lactoylglutathione lyase family enzyme
MLNRRDVIGASLAAVTAAAASPAAAAKPAAPTVDAPQEQRGFGLTPRPESNPLEAKIIAFTTVSPDVDASIRFYRDMFDMTLAEDTTLPADISSAPGIGKAGRRHAVLTLGKSAAVRVLQAPPNARANRPRPGSSPLDPGLMIMETATRDVVDSYFKLASVNTPRISTPRYYLHHENARGRELDLMSYSPFGPGGEQMFITADVRSERPEWPHANLHAGFNNAAIMTLDQRLVDTFYGKALGLKRTGRGLTNQKNVNHLMGTPEDTFYLNGAVGFGISIEIFEFQVSSGIMYPTALDRTGLAMLTMRVNDIKKCREMCKAAGIKPVGEGVLPLPGLAHREGFYLRGAVGELIEVVPA